MQRPQTRVAWQRVVDSGTVLQCPEMAGLAAQQFLWKPKELKLGEVGVQARGRTPLSHGHV